MKTVFRLENACTDFSYLMKRHDMTMQEDSLIAIFTTTNCPQKECFTEIKQT